MEKEYGGLENAGTFGAIYQPNDLNVFLSKWVYGWKPNEIGFATRAKTRLVRGVAGSVKVSNSLNHLPRRLRRPVSAC